VTTLVTVVLYAIISHFFGDHWWYLAIASGLWIAGIICPGIPEEDQ